MALHASGEDYLEAILLLHKKMGMVRSVDVARHIEVSKPSVCHAVATLREGGFLTMDSDYFLHLTDVGREVAEQIYEKHCFFTDRLIEAGVDPKRRNGTPAGWSTSSVARVFNASKRRPSTSLEYSNGKIVLAAPILKTRRTCAYRRSA